MVALLLLACRAGPGSHDSVAADSAAVEDSADTSCFECTPVQDVTVSWGDRAVTIELVNVPSGVTGFWWGLVQTTTDGWTGEDCLHGDGAWDVCHHFVGSSGDLTYVAAPEDVTAVDPQTTLLSVDVYEQVTYALWLDDGDEATEDPCFVWGDDPHYYDAFDCVVW